jgi:hypothetical protein
MPSAGCRYGSRLEARRAFRMKLLTWYGTIVRLNRAGRYVHSPLWPLRDIATDVELAIPQKRAGAVHVLPGDPPVEVHSVPDGPFVQLHRAGKYLSVQAAGGTVNYDRATPRHSETFLPLEAAKIARLRDILGHRWTIVETGEPVPPGGASITAEFVLVLGSVRVSLAAGVPELDGSRQVLNIKAAGGATMHAQRGAARSLLPELQIVRNAPPPPTVATAEEFAVASDASLTLQGGTEYGFLPLTARLAHLAWMHARTWRPDGPTLGPYHPQTRVVRQSNKFMLLTPGQEGIIFDESGICNEPGYMFNHPVARQDILSRDGDDFFIGRAVLQNAPVLPGCYAVFFNGNLSNYYHWIIDSLLPLFIMRPYLPPGTKLPIPPRIASLRATPGSVDHMAALREWGFGDMEMVEIAEPVCRLEQVVWLDHLSSINIIAETLTAARAHVWSLHGGPPPHSRNRNVYIRRRGSRGIANSETVEAMLTGLGFATVDMEILSPADQIELFRDASFVVAGHGAALANIMYCAPGTRILEISPDAEYRSLYAELSDKLELVHAVLPCPTQDDDFFGAMQVDVALLDNLLQQLHNWS